MTRNANVFNENLNDFKIINFHYNSLPKPSNKLLFYKLGALNFVLHLVRSSYKFGNMTFFRFEVFNSRFL
jgi:HJR/Mrr/RecB family endonuclease